MPNPSWFISRDGLRYGPFTWEQLCDMVAHRQLGPHDQLWSATTEQWQRADAVPGLFAPDDRGARTTPASSDERSDHESPDDAAARPPRRRWRIGVAVAVVVGLGLAAVLWLVLRPATGPAGPPQPRVGEILVSEKLEPDSAARTVTDGQRLSVTVPGGLLQSPQPLSIAAIEEAPLPSPGTTMLAGYDIRLGELHQFDQPLVIELAYDPAQLDASQPVDAQIVCRYWEPELSVWVPMGCQADEERAVMRIETDHLTMVGFFAVMNPYYLPTRWFTVDMPLRTSSNKSAPYSRKQYRFRIFVAESDSAATNKARLALVEKIEEGLREAILSYDDQGFELNRSFGAADMDVFVEVKGTNKYNENLWWSGYVIMYLNDSDGEELKHIAAHELFHSIEHRYQNSYRLLRRRWWMEACAEYAADEVIYGGKGSGMQIGEKNRELWENPLSSHADGAETTAYRAAHFVRYYLRRAKVSHKQVWDELETRNVLGQTVGTAAGFARVALSRKLNQEYIFDPLDELAGGTLRAIYRDFIAFHFFDSKSGQLIRRLPGDQRPTLTDADRAEYQAYRKSGKPTKAQIDAKYAEIQARVAERVARAEDRYANAYRLTVPPNALWAASVFEPTAVSVLPVTTDGKKSVDKVPLPGGFAGKMWGLGVQLPRGIDHRAVRIEVASGPLPAHVELCVYHLEGDVRRDGGVEPRVCLTGSELSSPAIDMAAEDGLYVLMVNTSLDDYGLAVRAVSEPLPIETTRLGSSGRTLLAPAWVVRDRASANSFELTGWPAEWSRWKIQLASGDDDVGALRQRVEAEVKDLVTGLARVEDGVPDSSALLEHGGEYRLYRATLEHEFADAGTTVAQGLAVPHEAGERRTIDVEVHAVLHAHEDGGVMAYAVARPGEREPVARALQSVVIGRAAIERRRVAIGDRGYSVSVPVTFAKANAAPPVLLSMLRGGDWAHIQAVAADAAVGTGGMERSFKETMNRGGAKIRDYAVLAQFIVSGVSARYAVYEGLARVMGPAGEERLPCDYHVVYFVKGDVAFFLYAVAHRDERTAMRKIIWTLQGPADEPGTVPSTNPPPPPPPEDTSCAEPPPTVAVVEYAPYIQQGSRSQDRFGTVTYTFPGTQTESYRESQWDDGAKKGVLAWALKDGSAVPHGRNINWNRDGSVYTDSGYRNGQFHGWVRGYHDNGKLAAESGFKDGLHHGPYRRFLSTGQLYEEKGFKDGAHHGWHKTYYPDGTPKSAEGWKDDKPHGPWRTFDGQGKLTSERCFNNGERVEAP